MPLQLDLDPSHVAIIRGKTSCLLPHHHRDWLIKTKKRHKDRNGTNSPNGMGLRVAFFWIVAGQMMM